VEGVDSWGYAPLWCVLLMMTCFVSNSKFTGVLLIQRNPLGSYASRRLVNSRPIGIITGKSVTGFPEVKFKRKQK